jgi:hypothetical protein
MSRASGVVSLFLSGANPDDPVASEQIVKVMRFDEIIRVRHVALPHER